MTNRMDKTHKTYCLIGGGIGLFSAVSVACVVGSPLPVLRLLGAAGVLPPLWLMEILWLGMYALAGVSAGYLFACPPGGGEGEALRWRGMTFLIFEVTFSFAWYSLLFGSLLLLPSWICLLLSIASGVVGAVTWLPVCKPAAGIAAGVALGQLSLWITQLAVILHN